MPLQMCTAVKVVRPGPVRRAYDKPAHRSKAVSTYQLETIEDLSPRGNVWQWHSAPNEKKKLDLHARVMIP